MTARPPKLAAWLVSRLAAADTRAALLGDLEEEFGSRVESAGPAAARVWYWRQVRRSVFAMWAGRRDLTGADGPSSRIFAGLGRDLRYATRALLAARRSTLVAVVILSLGIAASTTIFSVVDAVVLRGLPFPEPDQLVELATLRLGAGSHGTNSVAAPEFLDWRQQTDLFENVAATTSAGGFTTRDDHPEVLQVVRVTGDLFPLLRVTPSLGRVFAGLDQFDGNDHVAVISDTFWRRHFGADPHVIGRELTCDTGVWDIIGVMPPSFSYPSTPGAPTYFDLWIPYVVPAGERARDSHFYSAYLSLLARLRPGVSIARVQARLNELAVVVTKTTPTYWRRQAPIATPLRDVLIGVSVRTWMFMLLGAVGILLLIACINVASLLLARAVSRQREIGVRVALGAARWRLVRSTLVESLILTGTATVLGVCAAYWGVALFRADLPVALPRMGDIGVDWRVLSVAATVAIMTGILCGLVPALQTSRPDLVVSLREGGRSGTAGAAKQALRAALVVAEVALAVTLLVGSGLFAMSFVRLMHIDLGFNSTNVLTSRIDVNVAMPATPDVRAQAAARLATTVDEAVARIQTLPGIVHAAGLAGGLPLTGSTYTSNVAVAGHEHEFTSPDDNVDIYRITPGYQAVLDVPLLRGRLLAAADNTATAAPVVLLNDVAAARYFPNEDAVGQSIGIQGVPRTIVGVVRAVRARGPEKPLSPQAYFPLGRDTALFAYVLVKTRDDPSALLPAVNAALRSVAPTLAVTHVQTLDHYYDTLIAQRRFNMLLVGLFGLLGLAIAAVGIYGITAHLVEERTAEIGVRMALGADPGGVLRLVLRRAVGLVAVGAAVGLAGSWLLARSLAAFLFQIQPHDASVFAFASLALVLAGLVAALGPARRAARVDPLIALRAE
jgi:putative ABC transport system permease protein